MSNIKEQIRQEIERLKAENRNIRCQHNDKYCNGYDDAFSDLLSIIDSLPEEDTTEDLNELIQKWDRIDINTVLKVKVKATGKVIDGFYDGRGHFDHFIDHDVFDRYSIDEVELMPKED